MKFPNLKHRIDHARAAPFCAQAAADIAQYDDDDTQTMRVFDSDHAQAEGWDVFDCGLRDDGSPRIEIQHLDSPDDGQPAFESDHAAWDHVIAQAHEGSVLHIRALQMVDPVERKLIRCFCAPQKLPI